jgi:hypothetical protein
MDRTVDLAAALRFVIERIEAEATRSGEPLSDEQRFLLNHLPNESEMSFDDGGSPEIPAQPNFIPRDTEYERLCALTKAARQHDLHFKPESAIDWEFAAAVSKLSCHPMSWLLHWAGAKPRTLWWDRWLLFVTGLLVVLLFLALIVLGLTENWAPLQWAGFAAVYTAILALLYTPSRRIEEWQLKGNIERCRRGSVSTFVGS